MISLRGIALGLMAWSGLQSSVNAATTPSAASIAEGQKLAAEIRSQIPEENMEVNGILVVRNADGKRSKVPFHYQVIVGDRGWSTVYETRPSRSEPIEKLEVVRTAGHPNQYRHSPPTGTESQNGNADSLKGDAAMIPFAGSDFWLADLGLEFLHWPQQRIVEEAKIKMRKSRPCKVLESVNPKPDARGYTRVRSWIDSKTGGVILAEAYGPDNKLMKEFEIGGLVKINGQYELKNMEMRNAQSDTQTILEFKYQKKVDE
jgi:hypothetical protein